MSLYSLRKRIVQDTGDYGLVGVTGGAPDFSIEPSEVQNQGELNRYVNDGISYLCSRRPEWVERTYTTSLASGDYAHVIPGLRRVDKAYLRNSDGYVSELLYDTYHNMLHDSGQFPADMDSSTPSRFTWNPTDLPEASILTHTYHDAYTIVQPSNVVVADGFLWIYTEGNYTITKYTLDGTLVDSAVLAGPTSLLTNKRMHVNGGIIALVEPDTNKLFLYYTNVLGTPLVDTTLATLSTPTDVYIDGNEVYVLDQGTDKVIVFDLQKLVLRSFSTPTGNCLSLTVLNKEVFVSWHDTTMGVLVYSPTGTLLRTLDLKRRYNASHDYLTNDGTHLCATQTHNVYGVDFYDPYGNLVANNSTPYSSFAFTQTGGIRTYYFAVDENYAYYYRFTNGSPSTYEIVRYALEWRSVQPNLLTLPPSDDTYTLTITGLIYPATLVNNADYNIVTEERECLAAAAACWHWALAKGNEFLALHWQRVMEALLKEAQLDHVDDVCHTLETDIGTLEVEI